MAEWPVYVHAAAAVGPAGDTAAPERNHFEADPPPFEFGNLVKQVVGMPLRQASHLVELAALGSGLCLQRLDRDPPPSTAVYLATGLAEVRKTNALFFQVMADGHGMASPFDFINAANNMAAFYCAKLAGFRSRNLTVSQEEFSFEWAVKLATEDLRDGRFECALIGGVDENAHPREFHMRRIALDADQVMGEGSGWMFLSRERQGARGELIAVETLADVGSAPRALAERIRAWRTSGESIIVLPGFRMDVTDIAAIRQQLADVAIRRYLEHCGCFHTASAFGLAQQFDTAPERPELVIHVNRRPSGAWMAIAIRRYPMPAQSSAT